MFQKSTKSFIGFTDGTSRHTCNLASTAWVIYAPTSQLVTFGGVCLGPITNNMVEYSVVIELLRDVLHGISCMEVRLDSQLVVSQLMVIIK